MDTLASPSNEPSVLVVDENPAILVFIARILDTSGMRALMARNGREALDIAQRREIPINLIVTNAAILEQQEPQLLQQLRRIRPGVRDLSMAACDDSGLIRIQFIASRGEEPVVCDGGLVDSIRRCAAAPRVRHAGRLH